ncbi:MAG: DNA/RNA non-specific endonuclease [Acidobacteriota bacterium]|nr:DNA/RNA non-specific endonuclease [Acidobacteriota bacterium]
MKKFYFIFTGLILLAVCCFGLSYKTTTVKAEDSNLVSPNLVISQFQVAGGGTNAANDEFIELHNTSANSVDLNGYRLVYRSAAGTNDVQLIEWTTSTVIAPGAYYLVASTAYDGTTAPNITYNPTTCSCSMSATGGGLAIRQGALNTGTVIDSVGYGTATNAFVETAATAAPPANDGRARLNVGCQDTDNNANDFLLLSPAQPRNSGSTPNVCSGTGTTIFASGAANPNTVLPGGSVLFTVAVSPATTPPSTALTVVANLSQVGGASSQQFFDNGTNGDMTPGDNIFSYQHTIPATVSAGQKIIPFVAADAEGRTASSAITLNVSTTSTTDEPLLFGNPSNATTDAANENNYLMVKPQYTLSYNRSRATANWVAWRLDSSWIGNAPRQDDFRPDPQLPDGWYRVTDADYSGSGYDRGHMVPSGDRTRSIPDNSSTFLMTNIVPQIAANNQGPWEEFETYCRQLAQGGNELYIISGVEGNIGTIAMGRIVVPRSTWKVVIVLPNGDNDLQRVSKSTRVIAIVVPNFQPLNINAPWRQFRRSVDQVEALTGYNFFSNIPKNTQEIMERRRDVQ